MHLRFVKASYSDKYGGLVFFTRYFILTIDKDCFFLFLIPFSSILSKLFVSGSNPGRACRPSRLEFSVE